MKRSVTVAASVALFLTSAVVSALAAVNQWTVLRPGTFYSVAVAPSLDNGAPSVIYAGYSGDNVTGPTLLKSVNGGTSWTATLPSRSLSVAVVPSLPGTVYAATDNGLHVSADFGSSWTLLNADIRVSIAVNPANPLELYGDTLRSLDGGQSWTPMTGLPAPLVPDPTNAFHLKVSAGDPSTLLAYVPLPGAWGQGYPFISHDHGATWQEVSPLYRSDTYAVELDPTDARYYYVGYCNYIQYFWPTGTDMSFGNGDTYAIAVDPALPNQLYAVQQGSFWRSLNRGASWLAFGWAPDPPRGRMIVDGSTHKIYLPTLGTGLLVMEPAGCTDGDGDGFFLQTGCGTLVDCNDNNAAVHPGAPEICNDEVDNNCNGTADCQDASCIGTAYCPVCTDADGDGYFVQTGCGTPVDCNDNVASAHPGGTEVALDGIDQDCNGYDLTITITAATYTLSTSTLLVEATSSYGPSANLQLAGYGAMMWVPPVGKKSGKWSIIVTGVANPGTITVSGFEGSATATVRTVRK